MRPTPTLVAPVLLSVLLLFSGCSRKLDTIVGNERLIRGPQGLGTTNLYASVADQDTYLAPDSATFSRILLVGQSGTFQAKIFMKVNSWTLPDENLPGFTVDSVFFQLEQNQLRIPPVSMLLQLSQTTSAWDSSTVTWPGPTEGASLGSTTFDFLGPLRINMGPGSYTLLQQWAADPSLLPGLVLRAPGATQVAGFRFVTGTFQVKYTYLSNSVPVSAYAVTRVLHDFYLNSPITPAPTGADAALMLGGGYEAAVAVRVPIPTSQPGFSLDEGRLVFQVTSTFPAVDGSVFNAAADTTDVSVRIDAYRIRNDWTESTTDLQSIDRDILPFSFVLKQAPVPGDSLSLLLPQFLVREWTQFPERNKGMLIVVKSANVNPGMFVASRESATPPVVRLAYTNPPPYRF